MNETQTTNYGSKMAIIGSIGMSLGFGLAAVLNAFVLTTPEDWWLIGGPIGFGVSTLIYSIIVGWEKSK